MDQLVLPLLSVLVLLHIVGREVNFIVIAHKVENGVNDLQKRKVGRSMPFIHVIPIIHVIHISV